MWAVIQLQHDVAVAHARRDLLATSAAPAEENLQSATKEEKYRREREHRDPCCSVEAIRNSWSWFLRGARIGGIIGSKAVHRGLRHRRNIVHKDEHFSERLAFYRSYRSWFNDGPHLHLLLASMEGLDGQAQTLRQRERSNEMI